MQESLKDNLTQWNKISSYSKWIYKQFAPFIGKRVLDIGIGIGTFETFFIDRTDVVVGIDIFDDQMGVVKDRFPDSHLDLFVLNIEKDTLDVLMQYSFDTILCVNVLEHLENDLYALNAMKSLINENGKIVLFVPALSRLYCQMDKNAGHYRRYDKGMLNTLAEKAGLIIVKQKYFNFMGVLPYYLKGKSKSVDESGTFSTDLNETNSKMINCATRILSPLESLINIPIGLSEYVILQKQK